MIYIERIVNFINKRVSYINQMQLLGFFNILKLIFKQNDMSQKSKSKSKSKEKGGDKPPKDAKSKKSKQDKGDAKSKKSADKGEKASKGSKSKVEKKQKTNLENSRVQKPDDLASQSNFSIFKPFNLHPPPAKIDESLCPYHNEQNINFCEVCEQVGCASCLVYGPHNNQMHRITKLDEAFKARYLYLNELVCNDLLAKRQKLNKKLQDLNTLSDQLRFIKAGIQKHTRVQFNETMQRLNISAGNKFAILNHQMASLQQDLQGINMLGNEFFQLTNVNPERNVTPETNPQKGMVPFLLRAKALQQEAEQLISKPIKTSVDIFPYDLPRQVTEKKLILQKNKGWLDLLKVKDQAIWQLLEQRKQMGQALWEGFYQQASQQVQEWQKLNQKLREQVESFDLKCRQCGKSMDENSINQPCSMAQVISYHYFQ